MFGGFATFVTSLQRPPFNIETFSPTHIVNFLDKGCLNWFSLKSDCFYCCLPHHKTFITFGTRPKKYPRFQLQKRNCWTFKGKFCVTKQKLERNWGILWRIFVIYNVFTTNSSTILLKTNDTIWEIENCSHCIQPLQNDHKNTFIDRRPWL